MKNVGIHDCLWTRTRDKVLKDIDIHSSILNLLLIVDLISRMFWNFIAHTFINVTFDENDILPQHHMDFRFFARS